jgi:hypothetical protein
MDAPRPGREPLLLLKIVMMLLRFLAAILSFGVFFLYQTLSENLQKGLTTEPIVLK